LLRARRAPQSRDLPHAERPRRARESGGRAALPWHPPLHTDRRQALAALWTRRVRGRFRRAVGGGVLVLPPLGIRSGLTRGDLLLGRRALGDFPIARGMAGGADRPPEHHGLHASPFPGAARARASRPPPVAR